MSDRVTEYSRETFPFAGIYSDLTEVVRARGLSPLESYLAYEVMRKAARLTPCPDYGSTAMTTAGHNRNPAVERSEGMKRNIDTARMMSVAMHNQGTLDAPALILPVDFGYIPGWQQSDYIHKWLLTLGGLDLSARGAATDYEQRLQRALREQGVDLGVMNDGSLEATVRAEQYFKFAGACVLTAQQTDGDHHRVRRVISLVDPYESLGSQTERAFARASGIPVFDTRAVLPAHDVGEVLPDYRLRRDVADIISFGGTVCQLAEGPALICVRDDRPIPPLPDIV